MKMIVVCEFSGIVRTAFEQRKHNAWSCDLLPTERLGQHIQDDIKNVNLSSFDLMIAHPPCTYLASSGARWWKDHKEEQLEAIEFVKWLLTRNIKRIAIENPIGILPRYIRDYNQIIQPWQFGHYERKPTCLWLKNLPKLKPTKIVSDCGSMIHTASPSKNRWKDRSRTYLGIANAMAQQWGIL